MDPCDPSGMSSLIPPVATTLEEANEIIATLFRRVLELETKAAELESRLCATGHMDERMYPVWTLA